MSELARNAGKLESLVSGPWSAQAKQMGAGNMAMHDFDDAGRDRVTSGAPALRRRREGGVALLVAVMMLSIMGLIGLSSMESVMRDRQVAGFQSRARAALYAADAGVAWSRGMIFEQVELLIPQGIAALHGYNPAFPDELNPQLLGDGAATQPRFMKNTDPAIVQAIDYVGMGASCESWIMSDEYGGAQWREALFAINVEGRTAEAGNAARRIEATSTFCYPYF